MTNKSLMLILGLIIGALLAGGVFAATTTINAGLCTFNDSARNCATHRTATINVSKAGVYPLKVTVERGNNINLYECQDQESFYMIVNGQKTPVIADPDKCEMSGTVKTQNVSGTYTLKAGNNTVELYHAYTQAQANSIESLIVKSIEVVEPVAVKPTCAISASPTNINLGSSSTLNWSSTNATSSSIDQNIGAVTTTGARNVSPASNTTYTMTVNGEGGTATCSATVNVTIPVPKPTCAISANPKTINSGSNSTLNWSSNNATSASINQNIGAVTTTGARNVSPTSNTIYTMTVNGAGGTATCSDTVSVNVLTPAITIVKNDNDNGDDTQAVVKNGTATFKITVTNNGNAPLKDIIIYDEAAPNCDRTAAQTKGLYAGDLFDPKESFSYTCTDTNINEAYTNIAVVKANNSCQSNTSETLTDDDSSKVTVTEILKPTPEPEPTPEPKPTPEPTPEPKKDNCEGTIGNYIWLDANNDGVQDKNEKGIKGITVKLKTDDGKVVDKETTNSKGEYEFDDLCAGDYTVYVDAEDIAGYTQTYDPDGKNNNKTDITLKGNKDSHTKADFGYNKGRTTPVTGSGSMALTFTGLISMIGFASYRQLKQRMSDNILA